MSDEKKEMSVLEKRAAAQQWREEKAEQYRKALKSSVLGLEIMVFILMGGGIGYWLDQSHTGRGIMTRAVGALVDVLLVSCGFNRVVIETGVDNSASSAIPLRLGFRQEGRSVQRQWMYDRWVDSFQYAITASEWRANA